MDITIYQVKFLGYSSQSNKENSQKVIIKRANYFSLDSPKQTHIILICSTETGEGIQRLTNQLFQVLTQRHRGTHTGECGGYHTHNPLQYTQNFALFIDLNDPYYLSLLFLMIESYHTSLLKIKMNISILSR